MWFLATSVPETADGVIVYKVSLRTYHTSMTVHEMRLNADIFDLVTSGRKTIEARLYDPKRQTVRVGDTLRFVCRGDTSDMCDARVVGLLRYASFNEMFGDNGTEPFGFADLDALMEVVSSIYPTEEEARYGVVGIEFELLQERTRT